MSPKLLPPWCWSRPSTILQLTCWRHSKSKGHPSGIPSSVSVLKARTPCCGTVALRAWLPHLLDGGLTSGSAIGVFVINSTLVYQDLTNFAHQSSMCKNVAEEFEKESYHIASLYTAVAPEPVGTHEAQWVFISDPVSGSVLALVS